MSWSASDLSTYPDAPARSDSYRYCSLSYIDSISSLSSGLRLWSSAAAWIPVSFGIETSRIARSRSSASAFLTASAPSSASAITWRSACASRTVFRPERTIGWSSATRMRVSSGTGISRCGAGTSRRTSTPPSGPGLTASAPPTRTACSRIPRSPPVPLGDGGWVMPWPLSLMRRTTLSAPGSSDSSTRLACAWRTTLVRLSWATR